MPDLGSEPSVPLPTACYRSESSAALKRSFYRTPLQTAKGS